MTADSAEALLLTAASVTIIGIMSGGTFLPRISRHGILIALIRVGVVVLAVSLATIGISVIMTGIAQFA